MSDEVEEQAAPRKAAKPKKGPAKPAKPKKGPAKPKKVKEPKKAKPAKPPKPPKEPKPPREPKPPKEPKRFRSCAKADIEAIAGRSLMSIVEARFTPPDDRMTPEQRDNVLYELSVRRRGDGMREICAAAAHITGYNPDGLRRTIQELFSPEKVADRELAAIFDKPWLVNEEERQLKVCSRCQFTVARDKESVELLFGSRKITPKNPEREPYFTPQTWCRWCRTLPRQLAPLEEVQPAAEGEAPVKVERKTVLPTDPSYVPPTERESRNDFVPGVLSEVTRQKLEDIGVFKQVVKEPKPPKPPRAPKPPKEPKPKKAPKAKGAPRIRPEVNTSGKSSGEKAKAAKSAASGARSASRKKTKPEAD